MEITRKFATSSIGKASSASRRVTERLGGGSKSRDRQMAEPAVLVTIKRNPPAVTEEAE